MVEEIGDAKGCLTAQECSVFEKFDYLGEIEETVLIFIELVKA